MPCAAHICPVRKPGGSKPDELQGRIAAYFDGEPVDFGPEIRLDLDGFTRFQVQVLTACRQIKLGKTTSYGKLAKTIHRPAAARAVGNALSANPIPLIIPCHRVLAADNSLAGFSAPGGTAIKNKLLEHERMLLL